MQKNHQNNIERPLRPAVPLELVNLQNFSQNSNHNQMIKSNNGGVITPKTPLYNTPPSSWWTKNKPIFNDQTTAICTSNTPTTVLNENNIKKRKKNPIMVS